MKTYKKILVSLLTILVSISVIFPKVFAMEIDNLQNSEYFDENGNYFNPETGEYFIWTQKGRSTAKTFSFNFRNWLYSDDFKLNSANVKIKIYNAHFEYASGEKASCCNNHWFEVDLRRKRSIVSDTHNYASFYAPISSTKTVNLGSGFFTSDEYYIELTNHSSLPYGIYLVGEGEVYCS